MERTATWQARRQLKLDPQSRAAQSYNPEHTANTQRIVQYGRARQWEEAKRFFDELPEKNTILYSAMLSCADQCKRYEEGLELFEEMKANGVHCNATTYCSALSMVAVRQGVGAVESLLQEAESNGVRLNNAHFGCLLKACRAAGDAQKASEVLQRMSAYDQPNVIHFTMAVAAVSAAARAGTMGAQEVKLRLASLIADMAQRGVPRDAHFVEEEVRAILGGGTYGKLLHPRREEGRTPEQAAEALAAIERARAMGIPGTRRLEDVEDALRSSAGAADQAGAAQRAGHAAPRTSPQQPPAVPLGWGCALDPASGQYYYWRTDDPAGSTTWQCPV